MKISSIIPVMASLAVSAAPARAATQFQGGNVGLAANWSNGLPAVGNPGTIASDGSNGITFFGFGSGSEVSLSAGTITSVDGFNLRSGTWNISGGKLSARSILANGGSTVMNLSGGTLELRDVTGNQGMGVINDGQWNISGPVVLDATHATLAVQTGGTIDILADWSGSWTYGTHSGNEWRDLFLAGSIRHAGAILGHADFNERFTVTDGGKTLKRLADSPLARFLQPIDGEVDVGPAVRLGWTPPTLFQPSGYKVHFGTDPDVRANPATIVPTNSFDPPGELDWGAKYYWVVDALDGETLHQGTPRSFTVAPDPAVPYDPITDLARHNVTWDSPSSNSAGSMPLGNGDLGANVWIEPNGDLLLLLGKTDAWSDEGRLIKLGRLRIRSTPTPLLTGQPFLQTLNLPNGEILVTSGPPGDSLRLRIWADANHPALHVEADCDSPRDWQADLEIWRTTTRNFIDAGELNSAYGVRYGPTPPLIRPDSVVSGLTDRLTWYHRNVESIWQDTLDVQGLSHMKGQLGDPLLNRTSGATIYAGPGFVSESPTRLVSTSSRKNASFTVVALTRVTTTSEDWLGSLQTEVDQVEASPLAQRYAAHTAWWREFWQRHWMMVSSSGPSIVPGGDSFAVTRGYALQRFMHACSGRGGAPIKFNGSIFTVDATSSYDPDYRKWGPCYWWQNTRLPYWAMIASGDLDLMNPLFKMYSDALPLARERVRTYYGHAGAYFPETMYFWGAWNNDDYGWNRSGKPLGFADNAYIRWEWQGGIELLMMMLERHHAAPDEAFATGTLLPLAADIIDLYDLRYPRDPNGKIRFTPANSLETYQEGTQNPAPEIAGLRVVLAGLLNLPESLTDAALRNRWQRLLGELPPLPQRLRLDRLALSPAEVLGPKLNRESPELYSVFPYSLYQVGKPDLELADWTYQTRADQNPDGWGQDAIFAAMLGRTTEAKVQVARRFKTSHSGSRFPAMWAPNFDWVPDQTHGSVSMIALQKMLLLEDGERILLFPSWPADWDLKFRIHARGNTTIEGRLKGGQIDRFRISPPSRRQDVQTLLGTLPEADLWDQWRLDTPGAGGSPHDDGDQDGFVDLLEYALGGDPADLASPAGLAIGGETQGVVLHYDRPRGLIDLNYTLLSCFDLASDSWIAETLPPVVVPIEGGSRERVSYVLPFADGRRFYRLEVSLKL